MKPISKIKVPHQVTFVILFAKICNGIKKNQQGTAFTLLFSILNQECAGQIGDFITPITCCKFVKCCAKMIAFMSNFRISLFAQINPRG